MKRVLVLIITLLAMILMSCSTSPPYYEDMTKIEEPVEITCGILGSEEYWASYQLVMNEQETLYFAPKSLLYDGKIYLNDEATYFIYDNEVTLFEDSCTIVDSNILKEILRE